MDESSTSVLADAFKSSAHFNYRQLNVSTFIAGMIDRYGLTAYINELLPQSLNELTQNGQIQYSQVPNGACL